MNNPSSRRPSPRAVSRGAAAAICLLASAGAVHAQSCVQQSDTATTCRLMLTQAGVFTVHARATLAKRSPAPSGVTIVVNGQPCRGGAHTLWGAAWKACRIKFPAAISVVEASVEGQGVHTKGVQVRLVADDRLAAVPQEGQNLYPKGRRSVWSNLWPFH